MPRRRKQEIVPTNALVASATAYTGKKVPVVYRNIREWQAEAYRHYSICGEARFAATFFGHAVSRATLSADSGQDILDRLFNGSVGQEEMLYLCGVHLTIAGECYIVGREVDGTDVYEVLSVNEVQVSGTKWQIRVDSTSPWLDLSPNDWVIRVWLPDPRMRTEPDSPFRSLLPILTEIEYLTLHVFAQVRSRLAGAGLLMLPNNMTFPPPPEVNGKPVETANEADAFMKTLASLMLAPIEDPGSPAALIPAVILADPDAIDKAQQINFWTELDAQAKELRDEAIRRFALGMDLPPEAVLGMSSNNGTGGGNTNGVSHWGAWQVEESTIKMHIEPMLDVIVNALTIFYQRPLTNNPNASVSYDTSKLRLRPDRSKESLELYNLGLVGSETVIRENGFDPEVDRMDDAERQTWLLLKVASGSATPDQVQAALSALGVNLGPTDLAQSPRQARPAPSIAEHPTRPRTPEATLLAASEPLVLRALERAGNRLRTTGAKPPNTPSYEVHVHVKANGQAKHLLDDAWSCAPQCLVGIADPDQVIPVLDSYCSTLIAEQSPHTRERLAQWLAMAEVA